MKKVIIKLVISLISLSLSSLVIAQKIDKNFKYEIGKDDTPIEGKVMCVSLNVENSREGISKSFFIYTNYCSYRIEIAFFPLQELKVNSKGEYSIVDRPAAIAVKRDSLEKNESVRIPKVLRLQGTNGIQACKFPLIPKDKVTSPAGYICVKKSAL